MARGALLLLSGALLVAAGCSSQVASPPPKTSTTTSSTTTTTAPVTTTTSAASTLTVTPAAPVAGSPITVTGQGCPLGATVSVWIAPKASSGPLAIPGGERVLGETAPSASSSWSFTPTVPPAIVGRSSIWGRCVEPNGQVPVAYSPITVHVTTDAALDIQPSTRVAQGTTLSVTPLDASCRASSYPVIELWAPSSTLVEPLFIVGGSVEGRPAIEWPLTMTLPVDLPVGRYLMVGFCEAVHVSTLTYQPVAITVVQS